MKFTVIATDKHGVEKTINVEAETKESCEKGLTARGFTGLRFIDQPDAIKISEAPAGKASPTATAQAGGGWFADFMSFRLFVTTTYIKVIWWIGCILITLGVLIVGFSKMPTAQPSQARREPFGMPPEASTGGSNAMEILGILVAMPIVWVLLVLIFRIFCEFLIVVFRIYEELRQSNKP